MNKRSEAAWARFRARVEEFGGVVLEDSWKGDGAPHRVRCAEGHECTPSPSNLKSGQGLCRACAGKDPKEAERQFRARVAELGGTVLEDAWLGANRPHLVRCAEGHERATRPSDVQGGRGICRACAGKDPREAERQFRARVAELGGTVLEESWLGSLTPHRVRCADGHLSSPMPTNVLRGQGLCLTCAWASQDVLYVVFNPTVSVVKFGITSGDPAARLGDHRRDGFTDVVSVRQGLPKGRAHQTEQVVIKDLRAVGIHPVAGREYFDGVHAMTILNLIDRRVAR